MLLQAHSGFRYLVLLAGVAVIAYSAYGMVTKRDYDERMRVFSAAFTSALDITALLGFANLFVGTFYSQLGGHIVIMILASVLAHVVHRVMKRRPPEEQSYTPHLVGTLIVLGLVAGGVAATGRPLVG